MRNGPYTICHMTPSIDGRITSGKGRRTEEWEPLLKGYNEYYRIEKKFRADAWLCGRITAEIYASVRNTELPRIKETITKSDNVALLNHKGNYAVIVDTKGRLRWKSNQLLGDHLVIVITETTPKNYLAYLRDKKISYIIGGKRDIDFSRVFQVLKTKFGIKKMLIEGGGKLNGSILKAGLIDEISLLIAPLVVGSTNAPSIFDREPLSIKELPKRFQLIDIKRLKDSMIWVRYKSYK